MANFIGVFLGTVCAAVGFFTFGWLVDELFAYIGRPRAGRQVSSAAVTPARGK